MFHLFFIQHTSSISGSDMSLIFLSTTEHRPYPMPKEPWIVRQDWIDLCFCHWEMDPQKLQALLPPPLQIDTFEGKAYIGIVPFRMDKVRFRFVPYVPHLSSFPELNIRTYVRVERNKVFLFALMHTVKLQFILTVLFPIIMYTCKIFLLNRDGSTYRNALPSR